MNKCQKTLLLQNEDGGRWKEEQLDGSSSVGFFFAAIHSLSLFHSFYSCGTCEHTSVHFGQILYVAAKVNLLGLEIMILNNKN